jgi:hypothetical protein
MADYVYHFLKQQLEYWLKDTLERMPLSRIARKSFRLGMLHGFSEKLQTAQKVSDSSVHKAMILFKKDPALEDYTQKLYPDLKSRARNSITIDRNAFATGKKVGKTIVLKKAVSEEGGASGKLLT